MKRKIPEIHYRGSRICRVLGNPTAYEIVKLLAAGKQQPTEIAAALKLSIQTISDVLRSLRQLDLVRYENVLHGKQYFLKDHTVLTVISQLELLVKRIKTVDY